MCLHSHQSQVTHLSEGSARHGRGSSATLVEQPHAAGQRGRGTSSAWLAQPSSTVCRYVATCSQSWRAWRANSPTGRSPRQTALALTCCRERSRRRHSDHSAGTALPAPLRWAALLRALCGNPLRSSGTSGRSSLMWCQRSRRRAAGVAAFLCMPAGGPRSHAAVSPRFHSVASIGGNLCTSTQAEHSGMRLRSLT